jgi:hypothetical protein
VDIAKLIAYKNCKPAGANAGRRIRMAKKKGSKKAAKAGAAKAPK